MIHAILHFLAHFFGLDNLSGPYYGFWSGVGSDIGELAIFAAIYGAIRHHNCHVKGCKAFIRTAKDPRHGWYACKRHHSLGHLIGKEATNG